MSEAIISKNSTCEDLKINWLQSIHEIVIKKSLPVCIVLRRLIKRDMFACHGLGQKEKQDNLEGVS